MLGLKARREGAREAVVLVHGLWMHGVIFGVLGRRLQASGYAVHAFSYPTVRRGLDHNARGLADFVSQLDARTVHLVGHSLGGLVVLRMLTLRPDVHVGRVVLMGSPCNGSHCADVLKRVPGVGAIVGRSLRDWSAPAPPMLVERHEVGVLSGDRGFGMGRIFPGLALPNDGVVSLDETRLQGARDTLIVRVGHSEMLFSRVCAVQVAAFLAHGRFSRVPQRSG